ncbi:hypothetical protein [Porphyromonas cangingivalis]|uniref:hypothetical protein n=1 Tax=Porphyromonas cangingivalis TaxID=36874 RepID=UPI00051DEBFB|nr:hypothetical protein [Porphyromonas cangingivalis]KGL47857.1 hypothetical protein HQ34_08855 [Porphyromonas cangingivalis]
MIPFFILNSSFDQIPYEDFVAGFVSLQKIHKEEGHIFYIHESFYELNNYIQGFCTDLDQQRASFIVKFLRGLSPCNTLVESETAAENYCGSDVNGFLGIRFENTAISEHKKVTGKDKYEEWIEYYFASSPFSKLLDIFLLKYTSIFKKEFDKLNHESQMSIVREFEKAKKQNYILYPDTKIVKEVSIKDGKVLELRVFSPTALRIYFRFSNGIVYIASIGHKANPNQNIDIKNACNLLNRIE